MPDQTPTFLIRFSSDLKTIFEPEYDRHAELCKLDDECFAVFFDYSNRAYITPTKEVTKLDHRQWSNPGFERAFLMNGDLARQWVREKIAHLFQDPIDLWGENRQ